MTINLRNEIETVIEIDAATGFGKTNTIDATSNPIYYLAVLVLHFKPIFAVVNSIVSI